MKQYMVIPAPAGVATKGGDPQNAANLFAQIINTQAAQGWSYHSMETIAIQDSGCLARIINKAASTYYMLIFERDV